MATRILGIDLGAYSVKIILANPGFRQATVTELIERPVPPPGAPGSSGGGTGAGDDEPYAVRAARVLGQIVREHQLQPDTAYAAVPGDRMFVHILEFAFRTLRRADLEKAVGAELEGILPVDLEDMVFAFESLPDTGEHGTGDHGEASATAASASAPGIAPVGDDEPTNVQGAPRQATVTVHGRVAPPAEGMRVLACAMEIERARDQLELLDQHAVEPRGLIAAPGAYARLAERILATEEDAGGSARKTLPIAIIDIGHERTDVCVAVDGRAAYARTIQRGGRHVTEAIARGWHLSYEQAEQAKHGQGFVASVAQPAPTEPARRMHQAVSAELDPLGRELKRTLQSCLAKTGFRAARAVIVGGGSRLSGLAPFLTEKLRIPVSTLSAAEARSVLGDQLAMAGAPADVACLAAGVAMEGATGRPRFDLRQGELAYKADLSFLRQKATALAAVLLVILAFASIKAYAQLYEIRAAERNLAKRLAVETTELFGTELSASDALAKVQGTTAGQKSPLPRMTAYDILLEMNSKLPDRGQVTLDVENLEISPSKIVVKATAETSPQIDAIEEAFKSIECFDDISRGNTTIGSSGEREFSFSIKSSCM